MAFGFEDSVRAIVKARLNPDTEDIIRRKAEAESRYFADPSQIYDQYAEVADPLEKRRLVEGERQMLNRDVTAYQDILKNRETSIADVVGAFVRAKQEGREMQNDEFERTKFTQDLDLRNRSLESEDAYRQGQLAIDRSRVGIEGGRAAKESQTLSDQINELVAAGYTPEQARVLAFSKFTGSDPTMAQSYLFPPKPAETQTGPSFFQRLMERGRQANEASAKAPSPLRDPAGALAYVRSQFNR